MAQISRSTKIGGGTTLQANTTARAQDVETDVLTLFAAHNTHDSGTTAWQVVKAENTSAVPLVVNNSTGVQNIAEFKDNGINVFSIADGGTATFTGTAVIPTATITTLGHTLSGYRRPGLKYISDSAVDVENNTGTSNQTTIVFPDGSVRSVTEDTSSAHKYRRLLITADAEFTTGTEDSGLRAALTEATNTWYAIYAVKSAINASNFVLVGDTTTPIQANYSTLNSAYGANGWVYLGMIRNGDGANTSGDILQFVQAGNTTLFYNNCDTVTAGADAFGVRLANTNSAASLTWTYASGTGAAQIPSHISLGYFTGNALEVGSSGDHIVSFGTPNARKSIAMSTSLFQTFVNAWFHMGENIELVTSADDRSQITFSGYVDGALNGPTSIL
jgi:hypothetical protein